MTQKPRKGDFGVFTSKRMPSELSRSRKSVRIYSRSTFDLYLKPACLMGPSTSTRLLDSTLVVPWIELCMIVLFEWLFTLTNRL